MEEVMRSFNEEKVRYLLIGGQAMRLSGMPRFSMDWDVYIPPKDDVNLEKINGVLRDEIDLPVEAVGKRGENFIQTYQTRWGVIQFHLGGPGLPAFEEAEKRGVERIDVGGTRIKCMSEQDLLASKEAAGRDQDMIDAEFLRRKIGGRADPRLRAGG